MINRNIEKQLEGPFKELDQIDSRFKELNASKKDWDAFLSENIAAQSYEKELDSAASLEDMFRALIKLKKLFVEIMSNKEPESLSDDEWAEKVKRECEAIRNGK
jgi:predicted transcriptional regulator